MVKKPQIAQIGKIIIEAEFDVNNGNDVVDIMQQVESAMDDIACIGQITYAKVDIPAVSAVLVERKP